jgi:hypothetical protein
MAKTNWMTSGLSLAFSLTPKLRLAKPGHQGADNKATIPAFAFQDGRQS